MNSFSSPGPGSYNPNKNVSKKSYPKWRIGKASRTQKMKYNPTGPGDYESKPEDKGPMYSFAGKPFNSTQDNKKKNSIKDDSNNTYNTPGPGRYNIRNDKSVEVPTCKFGTEKKLNMYPTSFSPGPKYNTSDKVGDRVPKYSFGTSTRSVDKAKDTPGPDYKITNEFGSQAPKFSFGKEERGNQLTNSSPGPGKYIIEKQLGIDAKKITISPFGRTNAFDNKFPGPGAYYPNVNNIKKRYPTYRIGTAKRRPLYNNDSNLPAPDAYEPNQLANSTRPKSPSWKIGKARRLELYNSMNTPGVGGYNIASKTTYGPKYTFRGKFRIKRKTMSPGPGQYNRTNYHFYREPSWKFGTSVRDDDLKRIKRENFPGPMKYKPIVKRRHSGNIRFGKDKRFRLKKPKTPGPGQYRIPCEFDSVNEYTRQQGQFNENFRYI